MVNCDNCGEKIGLFGLEFDHKDKNGNKLTYCTKCDESFKKEEKEKEQKEEQKKQKEKALKLKKSLLINSKWEYKILNLRTVGSGLNATGNKINVEFSKELNQLGSEGWELVSAVPMNSLAPRIGVSSTATEWVSCIFKKKL